MCEGAWEYGEGSAGEVAHVAVERGKKGCVRPATTGHPLTLPVVLTVQVRSVQRCLVLYYSSTRVHVT